MRALFALLVILLAGPFAQAQSTLSISNIYALSGNDTLRWGDTSLQLDHDGTPGNAYIMTGEKVVAKLFAKLTPAAVGAEGTRTVSMDITLKANHEKENKHVEVCLVPNAGSPATVTEQFNFSGANGAQPVILSFNIALE